MLLVPAFLSVGATNDRTGAVSNVLAPVAAAMAGSTERLGAGTATLAPVAVDVAGTVGELPSGNPLRIPATYPRIHGRRHQYGALHLREPVEGANGLSASLGAISAAATGSTERLGDNASTLPAVTVAVDGSVVQFSLQRHPGWWHDRTIHGRRHQYGAIILAPSRAAEKALILSLPPAVAAATGEVVNPAIYAAGRGPRGTFATREARQRAVWMRGSVGREWLTFAPIYEPALKDINVVMPEITVAADGSVANPVLGFMSHVMPVTTVAISGTTFNAAGEVNAALPAPTVAATGAVAANIDGDINAILPQMAPAVNVASPITGDVAATLGALTADSGGTATVGAIEGQIDATLAGLTVSQDGILTPEILGQLTVTVGPLGLEAVGYNGAFLLAALPALQAELSGLVVDPPQAAAVGGGRGRKPRLADGRLALMMGPPDEVVPKKKPKKRRPTLRVETAPEPTEGQTPEAALPPAPVARVIGPAGIDFSAIAKKRRITKATPTKDLAAMDAAEIEEIMLMIEKLLDD
jgi:hypothetical protein